MNIKAFLKTPKGQLCVALSGLAVSWIFLFFYFVGPIDSLNPSDRQIAAKEEELKKLRKENEALKQRDKEFRTNEKVFERMQKEFWQPENGIVETDFRTLVQDAAKKAELSLNSLGAVKTSKINDNLFYAELDVQGNAPIEVIAAFLGRIQDIKPVLAWKRFDLRMDMRPRRNAENISSNELSFSGTLRVIVCGNQEESK